MSARAKSRSPACPSEARNRLRVDPDAKRGVRESTDQAIMKTFALFDTAVGCCAIAWTPRGIVGVQLPEQTPERTKARLLQYHPGAAEREAPAVIRDAIDRITALLRGEPDDLRDLAVDLTGVPEFHLRVYRVARGIDPGRWLTYGQVAVELGEPGAAQAVGQALGRNPIPIVVPCHRVVAAGGKLGGFSANGGTTTKRTLLTIEGADLPDTQPTLFG